MSAANIYFGASDEYNALDQVSNSEKSQAGRVHWAFEPLSARRPDTTKL